MEALFEEYKSLFISYPQPNTMNENDYGTQSNAWYNIDTSLSYNSIMTEAMDKISMVISMLSGFYLFVIIPSNAFTVFIICKSKTLWTPSNVALAVNGSFQIIGSVVMLILRPCILPALLAAFPHIKSSLARTGVVGAERQPSGSSPPRATVSRPSIPSNARKRSIVAYGIESVGILGHSGSFWVIMGHPGPFWAKSG